MVQLVMTPLQSVQVPRPHQVDPTKLAVWRAPNVHAPLMIEAVAEQPGKASSTVKVQDQGSQRSVR